MATLGAPDTLCTTDKDCEYTRLVLDGPTVCCDGCSYKVANKRWVVEAETTCATTHTDGCSSASEHDPATCVGKPPHLSCHEGRCAAGFSD